MTAPIRRCRVDRAGMTIDAREGARVQRRIWRALATLAVLTFTSSTAVAQTPPWDIFLDDESNSACDLINATNAELVVLTGTAELVLVSGTDLVLTDSFVDEDGFVFIGGEPFGLIDFFEDGDGFRTVWWVSLNGTVVAVDGFTGVPDTTSVRPDDFRGVPCDACDYWDDLFECDPFALDEDRDGVSDLLDLCPETPFLADVDDFGCACFEVDGDADGVDDCDDLCPETPDNAVTIDEDGCACFEIDSDADGVDDCDDDCPATPEDELPDFGGCSCSQLDDDVDGVSNCDDLCPDSPPFDPVDFDGCVCFEIDGDGDGVDDCDDECPATPGGFVVDQDGCPVSQPPIIIGICGGINTLTMMMTLAGLVGWRSRGLRFGSPR